MPIRQRLSRILLDHNLALDLRDLLPGHDVMHAVEMGWHQIGNGELLTIAEAAGFAIVITADQNIRYQQNLSGVACRSWWYRPITGRRFEARSG
jgi:predicted nuclease of predicted toxin-antitoxin system